MTASAPTTLRVLSWNIRSLRDGRAKVVAVLRTLAPDVAVLQEAPRLGPWRLSRRRLARAASLLVATHGWAAGNVVLVRPGLTVNASYDVCFPRRPGLHRRAVAAAQIVCPAGPVTVAGTHLDLHPEARLDSARRVRAALGSGPVVLGADVNESPSEPAWTTLGAGLVDARDGLGPTFPAAVPRRHIDALFVSPALNLLSCEVVDSGDASDHRPLLAVLAV